MEPKQMADLVKAARDAVSDVDEPWKTEAFKIILQRLIGGATPASSELTTKPGPKKKSADKKSAATKRDRHVDLPASTLRLGVEEIKRLKSYCDGFDLNGTEQVAFILANFAREHANLDAITASDIAYLHRMLISQRVKVVAINDIAGWTRALSWLTAPSRRKEWLEKVGNGFAVTNSGLLRWHEMEAEREEARQNKDTDK